MVAFSAICAHKMSHPAPSVSFINYRHGEVKFRNSNDEIEQRSRGYLLLFGKQRLMIPRMAVGCWVVLRRNRWLQSNLNTMQNEDTFYATATIGG